MDDIAQLTHLLESEYEANKTLFNVTRSSLFKSFLQSPLFLEKMARFEDPIYNPEETAGLYEDNLVVFVVRGEKWCINLIRHHSISKSIYALPLPSLIGPAGSHDACELEVYDYPSEIDYDLSNASDAKARHLRTVKLNHGDYWENSPGEPAYCLSAQSPDTIFLRITGPFLKPYSHAFDRTSLEYSHSGFSSPEVSAMDIYSNLIKSGAEAGYFSDLQEHDAARIEDAIGHCMKNRATAPFSEWNFIQALHAVNEERATSILREHAGSGGPLSAVARSTLDSIDRHS